MRTFYHLSTWLFTMTLVARGTLKEDARSLDDKSELLDIKDKVLKDSEEPKTPDATLGNLANLVGTKSTTPAPENTGSGTGEKTLPGTIKPAGGEPLPETIKPADRNPGDCKFVVSVQSDATYCLEEEPCSGSGPQPYAKGCPMKDTPAKSDCHCFLPSFVSKGNCKAPTNAICSKVDGSTWGCTFEEKGSDKSVSEPITKGEPPNKTPNLDSDKDENGSEPVKNDGSANKSPDLDLDSVINGT